MSLPQGGPEHLRSEIRLRQKTVERLLGMAFSIAFIYWVVTDILS